MQNSGSKIVLAMVGLAFLLGGVSWWYRYETARQASQFWGPEASRLIAESEGFEAYWADPAENAEQAPLAMLVDLSKARGQAHLRHALLTDRNYVWDKTLGTDPIHWKWTLRFFEGDRQVEVKFSENLRAIGKYVPATDFTVAHSCEPMTSSLKPYFQVLGLIPRAASTVQE